MLELGCGAGAAALCLAARVAGLDLHGLELQPAYAELARRNAAENGLSLEVHEGDLRRMPPPLRRLAFDHVLANPPFHPGVGAARPRSRPRPRPPRGGAARRLDRRRPPPACVPAAGWSLIHRAARLGEILAALAGRAGGDRGPPRRLRAPASRPRACSCGRSKGSKAPLTLWFPLTFHRGSSHEADGESYTAEAQRLLRDMGELLPDARSGGTTT